MHVVICSSVYKGFLLYLWTLCLRSRLWLSVKCEPGVSLIKLYTYNLQIGPQTKTSSIKIVMPMSQFNKEIMFVVLTRVIYFREM